MCFTTCSYAGFAQTYKAGASQGDWGYSRNEQCMESFGVLIDGDEFSPDPFPRISLLKQEPSRQLLVYGGSVERFLKALEGRHAAGLERRPFPGSLMRAFFERLSRYGVSRREAWL